VQAPWPKNLRPTIWVPLFTFALTLLAAPATAQVVPTCEPLFASAPTIASIDVVHRPPLGAGDRLPSPLSAAAVNRLHATTRPGVIERELLFHTGERLDRERLRDTLRHLRGLGYLRREQIRCTPLPDNRVRIEVVAQDAWAIEPIVDFAAVDAGTAWTIGVRDTNLAGYGKRLAATYANRFGDPQVALHYLDTRLGGSWWQGSVDATNTGSGESVGVGFSHPFYSLETAWAASLTAAHRRGDEAQVDDGVTTSGYRATRQSARVEWARALVAGAPVVHRAGLFAAATSRRFTPTASTTTLPTDRSENAVGLFYRRLGVGFVTERHIDHFDRPEYINLANDLTAEAGLSATALGSDKAGLLFALTDGGGHRWAPGRWVRAALSASGRLESGRLANVQVGAGIVGVVQHTLLDTAALSHTLLARANVLTTRRLDDDRFLSLGASTGLRGYNDHAITGDTRLRLTVEDRLFAAARIAGVVAVGGLAFVDSGTVWRHAEGFDLASLSTSAGLGLRLAWPVAASEQVIRLDLAFPLDRIDGDNHQPKVTFLTTTRF